MLMLAEVSPFIDSLQHIVGFIVVLIALGLLWGLTSLLGLYFQRFAPARAAPPGSPGGGDSSGQPSEEEVVAVTAAISMLMGQQSRIVSLGSAKKAGAAKN